MLNTIKNKGATIKLCLQHHDTSEAIEWFCSTFGFDKFELSAFEEEANAKDVMAQGKSAEKSAAVNAQRAGMNLLIKQSRIQDNMNGEIVCELEQDSGGSNISNDQVFEIRIRDDAFGGRIFTCYDLEGQVWNFGIYNP